MHQWFAGVKIFNTVLSVCIPNKKIIHCQKFIYSKETSFIRPYKM